jgi:hypothetical protein
MVGAATKKRSMIALTLLIFINFLFDSQMLIHNIAISRSQLSSNKLLISVYSGKEKIIYF